MQLFFEYSTVYYLCFFKGAPEGLFGGIVRFH